MNLAKLICVMKFSAALVMLTSVFSLIPALAGAQTGTAGQNAVCPTNSGCSPTTGSSAFIDAIGFIALNRDFCAVLNNILKGLTVPYPANGAVIDARGLPGTTGTHMTCSDSPWGSGTGYQNKPSTILLPSGTITIQKTWVLPSGTTLVGQETTDPTLNNSGNILQTTIQAANSPTSFTGAMLQFGDSTHCPSFVCTDISVEHLTLDGNNQTITGILNQNSQDHTSVNHVTLYRILGTGLSLGVNPSGGDASNSGPYSNINYDTGSSGAFASTCASINGLSGTKGIHGLTCTSTPDSSHAILLDSSNNTLRDIRIVGFFDGILVGSQNAAHSNILFNVIGDTASPDAPVGDGSDV
jgi:hypothetical protein